MPEAFPWGGTGLPAGLLDRPQEVAKAQFATWVPRLNATRVGKASWVPKKFTSVRVAAPVRLLAPEV